MEDYGWIKLHRKLTDNPIFRNAELLQLFIYCLLKANFIDKEFLFNNELINVKRGQFVTGRKVIAKDLKQNENSVYTRLKLLEKLGYISLISNNKFSLLTVVKYESYQSIQTDLQQQDNNGSTTSQQQDNTTKKDKERIKKDKNKTGDFKFANIVFSEKLNSDVFKETYQQWYDYLKEKSKPLTKSVCKLQFEFLESHSAEAVEIIQKSMRCGWIGLFELNKNNNGTSKAGKPVNDIQNTTPSRRV